MKIISMKSTDDDDYGMCCSPSSFGYGLQISLSEDQCEALGISKAMAAGTGVTLSGKGIVVSSTESVSREGEGDGPDVCVSIQITDLGVQDTGKIKNAAQVLYGSD